MLATGGLHRGEELLHLDAGVPDLEMGHVGILLHPVPVGVHRPECRPAHLCGLEAVVTPGGDDTCGEPLQIPLERAVRGLVEVVEIEHQATLRAGERTEVQQVGIAAQPHLEVRRRA